MLVALSLATPARAGQEEGNEGTPPYAGVEDSESPDGGDSQESPYPRWWAFSAFGGRLSGGTPIGSVGNPFFLATFETDSDGLWGVRGAGRIFWRLGFEVEYARSSPGLDAVLTDLLGRDRTVVPFSSLEISYLSAAARMDLTDSWLVPFLMAGIANVSVEVDESRDESAAGLLFGGGVEVPLPFQERIFIRGDVRGLRSDVAILDFAPRRFPVDGEAEEATDELATHVIWTIGLGVRF